MNLSNQSPNITPSMIAEMQSLKCTKCDNIVFVPRVVFKKVSSILSASGETEFYPIQYEICSECNYISPLYEKDEMFLKMIHFDKTTFDNK